MRRRKNLWGWDVYAIAFVIVSVHLAVIIAKFFGKDLGPTIPESLDSISIQLERVAFGYTIWRAQRQVNTAHQRVTKMKGNANHLPAVLP
jgi:membrane protein implicated in regulation of membrane protease activity